MAKISIRYFVKRKRGDGTFRYVWQPDDALREKGWKFRRLSDDEAIAMKEAIEINRTVDEWRDGQHKDPVNYNPGSLNALIDSYKKSRRFKSLSANTQRDYQYYLDIISQWAGDVAATSITAKMGQDLYNTICDKKPRKAVYIMQVGRSMFSHAERESLIPIGSNPFRRPGTKYRPSKGVIWSPEAVAHFVRTADEMKHFSVGSAVMLNEWWGQRRGDLVKLSMSAFVDGNVTIHQSKTGAIVIIDMADLPAAQQARLLEQIERNKKKKTPGTRIFQQREGMPYSEDGFMTVFEKIRARAAETMPEMKHLVFKDLRHTTVTRLAEAGAEIPEIAAVTGHSFKTCQDIVDRYNVRTKKMAGSAMRKRRSQAEQE